MTEPDLTHQVDLAVRAHVRPGPRFPEAVWAGRDIRLQLWAEQAADVAQVLGLGVGLPLGMELAGIGVRTSMATEVDGVSTLQMPEQHARHFAAMLDEAMHNRPHQSSTD
ncbi:hypothetical protein [Streptomyces demainii]|uniref:Uncharacterized protein n=1 Tax=Streptomyces demainii TaxID=588122 RepID=A0ABT9L6W1_9ACTN|nr:hypothetical protein [Streptomyces demainii]MDP9616438.1 hypothetical protein [Streptomyces demainii]